MNDILGKKKTKAVCLAAALILFLILAFLTNVPVSSRTELLKNENRTFEKGVVTKIVSSTGSTQQVRIKMTTGSRKGKTVKARSTNSYLYGAHCSKGDHVVVIFSTSGSTYDASVYSIDRGWRIWLMAALFAAIVILIGGKKGFYSIAGLAYTILCVIFIFLPMVYRGFSPIFTAVLICAMTTFATFTLIDGLTRKSLSALAGTTVGVIGAGAFAVIFGAVTGISGYNVSDIEDLIYVGEMTDIKIGELLFAGILIAALGAVMDVGMSVASFLDELHEKKPELTSRELFRSGMNVGRDMMGTMTNTLILAFAGGSINTLIYVFAYAYPYRQVINMYSVGIELMQGLSSSLGVVLTIPATAFITSVMLKKSKTCTE
ncbi:MAG: YibE/F family protein [Anaerovoracaceae bacterium]